MKNPLIIDDETQLCAYIPLGFLDGDSREHKKLFGREASVAFTVKYCLA